MQNNEQSLLLIHRENYNVPKGQERSVHCKVAKLDAVGNLLEKPRLVHFGVKAFDTYDKANLEAMGFTVEILYHPQGRYSNVVITDKDVEIAKRDKEIETLKEELAKGHEAEIAEKDAEIARLKAELAEKSEPKVNKGGRPRKEA